MLSGRSIVVAALMVSVALAGCTGGDDAAAKSDADQAPTIEVFNGIEGVVRTEDLLPVKGAAVEVISLELTFVTGEDGRYQFVNLEPRDYLIVASMLGFKTKTQRAIVAEGKIHQLDFTLEERPLLEPWRETQEQAGLISCAFVVQTDPENQDHRDCSGGIDPNDKSVHEFMIKNNAAQVLIEVEWDPTTDAAKHLTLSVESVGFGHQDLSFGTQTGPSGVRVSVPQSVVERFYPEGGTLRTTLRAGVSITGDEAGMDAGAAIQQPFTVYVTVFYIEPGAAGFSAFREL